jgi:hypothetical protein
VRIIIAGSRSFNDYDYLKEYCTNVIMTNFYDHKLSPEIISGHASGADMLGEKFANEFGYKLTIFPADWDKYGKSAGYRRNVLMAEYAKRDPHHSILVAFWDGKSKGTLNMLSVAEQFKLDKIYDTWNVERTLK